jgi:aryl-alcohol dehydrogenase-like predicted oxidoreductase
MSKNLLNKIILGTAQFNDGYGRFNKNYVGDKEILKILKYCKTNKISFLDTSNNYKEDFKKFDKKLLKYFNIIYKFSPTSSKSFKSIIEDLFFIKDNFAFERFYCFMLHDEQDHNTIKKKYFDLIKKLKKLKLIKKFGISIYNFENLEKYILNKNIDVIQLPYNVFDNRFQKKKIQLALKKRKSPIEIHARSIFLQGLLLQNHKDSDPIIKKNNKLFKKWDNFNENNQSKKISNCINFVKDNSKIDKILVGIDSLKQLKMFVELFVKNEKKKKLSIFNSNNNKNIIDPRKWKKK